MKLLFDHNLSPQLVHLLADLFPESSHVFWLGLDQVEDRTVREFALENDFVVVSKDADFSELCWWLGFPPKVIWIRRGNCKTSAIAELLRFQFAEIQEFSIDQTAGVITLI